MTNNNDFLQRQSDAIDNFNRYAEGLDSKNWQMVSDCFADEFHIDYGQISAPSGAPEAPRINAEWMVILQSVINGFDVTRHCITNHRVIYNDERYSCKAYLSADHIIFPDPAMPFATPDDVVTVVGEYENHYALIEGSYRIVRSALNVHWSSGNMALFDRARDRAEKMSESS